MMEVGVMSGLAETGRNVDVVAEYGLKCCQVVSWNCDLCKTEIAERLRDRCAERGVRISAFWAGVPGPAHWNFTEGPISLGIVPSSLRWMRVDALRRWADFAKVAGAPAIITHCGFLPENMTDPEFEGVVLALRAIASHCRQLGLGFWFETGQETPVTLLRHIQKLEEAGLDNLGINLDPANLLMYGKGNPIDALDVFGKYVRCIHAKDGKVPTNGTSLGPEVRVGTGMVRYPEFIRRLKEIGYTGDLTIEREIRGEQQRIDILQTVEALRKWVAEA